MNALRALQKVESVFMQKLSVIYGCDEDEVPVEIDLLGVYNDERSTRLESLVRAFIWAFMLYLTIFFSIYQQSLLVGAPGDVSGVLSWVMTEMDGIDELPK